MSGDSRGQPFSSFNIGSLTRIAQEAANASIAENCLVWDDDTGVSPQYYDHFSDLS
jgi:hypothetical protein